MMRTYVGIDNGVTGSIGIIRPDGNSEFHKTPIFMEQNYTKKKDNISRIDTHKLKELLETCDDAFILIERPMVNPKRLKASFSALRALEATLVTIELLEIPYLYIDSKEWQKTLLPSGVRGSVDLKKASVDIGKRLFPLHKEFIQKNKDADGILIAEYGKRQRY